MRFTVLGAGMVGRAIVFDLCRREDEVRKVISGSLVAIGAISYRFNELFTRIAIDEGVHFVDLGGNNDVVNAQFALSQKAKEANVAVVPDCGIALGAVSIFAARLLEIMPTADSVKLRVGGLPLNPSSDFQMRNLWKLME